MQIKKWKEFFENKWYALSALFSSLLIPSTVLAQNQGPFTVDENDMSKTQIIDYLFGPISGAGGESALSPLIEQFNYVILILGGIYVAYTLIKGTVDSAHDGQILGRKWSQAWLPVRTAVFTAAIFPALPGGFAAIQWVVLWLAMQGIGVANVLWGAYATSPLNASSFQTQAQIEPLKQVYRSLLLSHVCMEAINFHKQGSEGINTGGVAGNWVIPVPSGGISASVGVIRDVGEATITPEFVLSFRTNPAVTGESTEICGNVTIQDIGSSTNLYDVGDGLLSGSIDASTGASRSVSAVGTSLIKFGALQRQMFPIHLSQVNSASSSLNSLAKNMVADLSSVSNQQISSTINTLASNHAKALSSAAESFLNNGGIDSSFTEAMKKDGWLMAGAFYMNIAAAQDKVTKAISSAPGSSSPPDMTFKDEEDGVLGASWRAIKNFFSSDIDSSLRQVIQESYDKINLAMNDSSFGVNAISAAQAQNQGSSWTKQLTEWFINGDASFTGDNFSSKSLDNPILSARGIGEGMVTAAWGGLAAGAIGSALTGPGTPGLWAMLAPIFFMIFSTLIVAGSILMVYLPMMPFILWIGVVFGWVVLLVEAIIAAPLWAVVHLAPDGDDVVGKGGQGYMLVLSLTLRPGLMIFGLVAAIILMKPLGFIINSTFSSVFDLSMQAAGGTGFTTMIAGMVIYCVFMVQIVHRVFSLIHHIPDNLLKWISIGGGELGQEANAINQGVSGSTVAGLSAMHQTQSAVQSGVAGYKNAKQGEASREQQRFGQAAALATEEAQMSADQANTAGQKANDARLAKDPIAEKSALQESVGASQERIMNSGKSMYASAHGVLKNPETTSSEKSAAKDFISGYDSASKQGPEAEMAFIQSQAKQFRGMDASSRPAFAKSVGGILAATKQIQEASSRIAQISADPKASPSLVSGGQYQGSLSSDAGSSLSLAPIADNGGGEQSQESQQPKQPQEPNAPSSRE